MHPKEPLARLIGFEGFHWGIFGRTTMTFYHAIRRYRLDSYIVSALAIVTNLTAQVAAV
jgi:hypothetical protein